MKRGNKVLWSKGTIISPQHLQAQDRFLEGLIDTQRSWLTPFCWGFSRLEFDREALASGTVSVLTAAGILPDGLLFDMPASDETPPARMLQDGLLQDQGDLVVHLGIPGQRVDAQNVSGSSQGTRYRVDTARLRDENTGASERAIEVARRNFKLLCGIESREGHTTLPAARLIRRPGGGFDLDPLFLPPLLDFAAANSIVALTRTLVELLTAKSNELSQLRRQRNRGLADFGIADVASFWLLHTVNGHLPAFRHLLDSQRGHPLKLFEAMLSLAGALTAFSSTITPSDLPAYNHADLARCLTALDQSLRELLETVIPRRHLSVLLVEEQPGVFAAELAQDPCFTAEQVYLAIRSNLTPDQVVLNVPKFVKIASRDDIGRLIKASLPGLRLQHVPRPPAGLPARLDHQYFAIDRSGEGWDAVRRHRNLAAFVPKDLTEPQLELLFVLPAPIQR